MKMKQLIIGFCMLAACFQPTINAEESISIVGCPYQPSKYERILMTQLRDKNTKTPEFRLAAKKVSEILLNKVVECLPTTQVNIETPVTTFVGEKLPQEFELVSVMRSGDALLDTFLDHFPHAKVSKFLVQRDEKTAEAHFIYMKLSPTLASGHFVIITEPMIATGGSLSVVIQKLKDHGVQEDKIIVASICTAPEGLALLNKLFPKIKVVMTMCDEGLNEKKYIVPGLGDFGDRYFGTVE